MLVFLIGLVGFVLTILGAVEIYRLEGDTLKKILFIVLLFATNWMGVAVYYIFARKHIAEWVK